MASPSLGQDARSCVECIDRRLGWCAGIGAPRRRLWGRCASRSNEISEALACAKLMHKTLREMPSLDFLRGFEAAGRTLSFTRAAAELFVTQSALSRQVKALEDALGVPLFERR